MYGLVYTEGLVLEVEGMDCINKQDLEMGVVR